MSEPQPPRGPARGGGLGLAALLALTSLGCSEYSYTQATNKDVFQQVRRNTVDVLMVVDNSCSMAEEQEKLAGNFQAFIGAFEGVDVDWQIATVTTDTFDETQNGNFLGGSDEIKILSPSGSTLDEVSYDLDWGIVEGVSLQLDPESFRFSSNDKREAWCEGTASYGDGGTGSPGAANEACASSSGPPDTGAPDTGVADDTGGEDTGGGDSGGDSGGSDSGDPRAPKTGDLVITEFMAQPAVDDSLGEWVEITNISEDTIDLSGCFLGDDGRNRAEIPDGVTLEPGDFLVLGRSADTAVNGGVSVDVELGADFTLNDDVLVLTPETEAAGEIFGEMVAVGVEGSGIEMGLEAARLALSPEYLEARNTGFLREDANLSLIFVSDENDYSPLSVNDYLRFFKDLKGDVAYRNHGMVNISAVVGDEPPPYEGEVSCESENGFADYGARYVDLAARTEGARESICDEDFSPIAAELGLTISGLQVEFYLSELPDDSTLVVSLYADQTEDSFVRELIIDEDYTYHQDVNAIRFVAGQVPESETWIVVEYRVLATGASNVEGGEG